jgi:hypothetical protein
VDFLADYDAGIAARSQQDSSYPLNVAIAQLPIVLLFSVGERHSCIESTVSHSRRPVIEGKKNSAN